MLHNTNHLSFLLIKIRFFSKKNFQNQHYYYAKSYIKLIQDKNFSNLDDVVDKLNYIRKMKCQIQANIKKYSREHNLPSKTPRRYHYVSKNFL